MYPLGETKEKLELEGSRQELLKGGIESIKAILKNVVANHFPELITHVNHQLENAQ